MQLPGYSYIVSYKDGTKGEEKMDTQSVLLFEAKEVATKLLLRARKSSYIKIYHQGREIFLITRAEITPVKDRLNTFSPGMSNGPTKRIYTDRVARYKRDQKDKYGIKVPKEKLFTKGNKGVCQAIVQKWLESISPLCPQLLKHKHLWKLTITPNAEKEPLYIEHQYFWELVYIIRYTYRSKAGDFEPFVSLHVALDKDDRRLKYSPFAHKMTAKS